MSLLEKLREASDAPSFDSLGYGKNPFPPRGQVQDDVYVERPELASVEDSLARFLKGRSAGRTWAVAGESGIGKSNFLRHLSRDMEQAQLTGVVSGVAYRYLTSQQLTPRQLAEAIAMAIGADAFGALFTRLRGSPYTPTAEVAGTALGDFLSAVAKGVSATSEEASKFAIHWLGGQQTYSQERREFDISMRERTPPAVALPWLRHLLDLMESHNILSRLVLLLDEFEDVQSLGKVVQNDYLSTLKGLLNAFNLDRLFLVLAGQPTAFDRLGQRFPSLATRWEVVTLDPLRRPEDAVRLARQYMDHEHRRWLASNPSEKPKSGFHPSDLQIQAIFGDLLSSQPVRGVTQRDLLARLHDWVEAHLQSSR